MGAFEHIETDGGRFAVSMVKWGSLRRAIVSLLYRILRPNRFEQPSFVPEFEMAVFSQNTMRKPVISIHFADEESARRGWEAVTAAMKERGLSGATDYVCNIRLSEMREFGKMFPGITDRHSSGIGRRRIKATRTASTTSD